MPLGIRNVTAATLDNLTEMVNVSEFPEMAIKVNHIAYGGYLYFFLLILLWVILYFKLQDKIDQPMINIMYSGALVTLASLFLRAITMVSSDGIVQGLLTDVQMWVFPLITMLVTTWVWMAKRRGN